MLALGLAEGEDVMIGNDRLVVERLKGKAATLAYETETMINKHEIVPNMTVQLSPQCRVSLGVPSNQRGFSGSKEPILRENGTIAKEQLTLRFDAPRQVPITRGHLYRKWGRSHDKPQPAV